MNNIAQILAAPAPRTIAAARASFPPGSAVRALTSWAAGASSRWSRWDTRGRVFVDVGVRGPAEVMILASSQNA